MNLAEFRETQREPLIQKTLLFLVKDREILLAMKKRDFGKEKWNGLGGKIDKGESIEDAAAREAHEEAGILNPGLKKVAELDFFNIPHPEHNQQVIVFVATAWEGVPHESEEMAPQWFSFDEIPYAQMWPDDAYWLPHVLNGEMVIGSFLFGENDSIEDYELTVVEGF